MAENLKLVYRQRIVEDVSALRITPQGEEVVIKPVAREFMLTVFLNNNEIVTLLCYPIELEYLTAGFLLSEGLISARSHISELKVDYQAGAAFVKMADNRAQGLGHFTPRFITSGCGGSATFYSIEDAGQAALVTEFQIPLSQISATVTGFQRSSKVYRETHGVHSAAVCQHDRILVFSEDIGRHNAVDKVLGRCLLEDIPTDDKYVITSGRISLDIVNKVIRRQIPLLVSSSSPLNMVIKLADKLGITLIGSASGTKIDILTHDYRVLR